MENILINIGLSPISAKVTAMLLICVAVLLAFVAIGGILTWVERRLFGFMQSRLGPNRVGPFGALQWVADGLKLVLKEDLIPDGADRLLFKIAPYFCLMGVFGTMVVFPWGSGILVADLNVGLFYFISITALVVIGVLMAGWSSNNKWSLLGGMRAAAQIVSYEIPVGLGLLVPILITGSLSMVEIQEAQGWLPWQWMIFNSPFAIVSFIIFFIGSLAEANRTPFDLPEAESELVSGYCTEYTGFRYAVFFLTEWANIFVLAGLTTTVFLGAGNLPESINHIKILSFFLFMIKSGVVVFIIIWIRWTLPRFRVDQLMKLSWKYMLPWAVVSFFGQAIYMLFTHSYPMIGDVVTAILVILTIIILVKFSRRVVFNMKQQNTPVNSVLLDVK